jgi:hypothetical protein
MDISIRRATDRDARRSLLFIQILASFRKELEPPAAGWWAAERRTRRAGGEFASNVLNSVSAK